MAMERQSALRVLMHGMCEDDVSSLLPLPELAQRELVLLNVHAFKFDAAEGSRSSGVDQQGLNLRQAYVWLKMQ